MSTNTAVIGIAELVSNHHFLVEDYQRGYKWTEVEVEQLLNDIYEFNGRGFYCLQPIVVKRVEKDGQLRIELIDGQQRITTIFIILSFLNINKFHIEYRTRKSSVSFLEEINQHGEKEAWSDFEGSDKDNIDNYHFFQAYRIIRKWFEKKEEELFIDKLLHQVKVIWYEISSATKDSRQESIKIFSRINSGKIPLTNAELIKALFLINVDEGNDGECLHLKQNEVAQQWDAIEYALQDDSFWYFLSNEEPPSNRIEFIFDLLAKKPETNEDQLFTFLEYHKRLTKEKEKSKWVEEEWEEVKSLFLTLQEWYGNRRLYHFIGFLIWKRIKLKDIILWKEKAESRSNFEDKIIKKSKIKLKKEECFEELEYGDNRVKQALLLFNILTLLQSESSNNFSFANFKCDKWDIEHIRSQKSAMPRNEKEQRKWLKDVLWYLTGEENEEAQVEKIKEREEGSIENRIYQYLSNTSDSQFEPLYKKVLFCFREDDEPENKNYISNLALLDAGTNRAYKNAVFPIKRKTIIERDIEGAFIPICTKNVFLKYYSNDVNEMLFWKSEDATDYINKMKKTIKDYLTSN